MLTSFYSPLRYPGGKQKLAKFIDQICVDNNINGHYVEPYAGGASVALYLLLTNRVKEITINDLDKAIYAFWWSVKYRTFELRRLIDSTDITIDEWYKQKSILSNKNSEKDLLKLGFAALFLNRTNYSGILNAGVIGGAHQKGKYRIDCRFNKQNIVYRIKLIGSMSNHINIFNLDALDLVENIKCNDNTIFYFDPPYFLKGESLYMNHYQSDDHRAVSEKIKSIKDAKWIVSYDNAPEIHDLYDDTQLPTNYVLHHSARTSRLGNESIFFSDNLIVKSEVIMSLSNT